MRGVVPEATSVFIRGWMQMVSYYHMIYSPATNNQGKTSDNIYMFVDTTHIQNNSHLIHNITYSVHDGFLMPHWNPSCYPPGSPMGVPPPPLLQINCLSCSSQGGPGPPFTPLPELTPFPQGPCTHPSLRPLQEWSNSQNWQIFLSRQLSTVYLSEKWSVWSGHNLTGES
jgi:hypothetical protein